MRHSDQSLFGSDEMRADYFALTAALYQMERAAVGSVLGHHPHGILRAKEAGLHAGLILSADLRLIFIACEVQRAYPTRRDDPTLDAMLLAVKALKAYRLWDAWSPEALVELARVDDDGPGAWRWCEALVKLQAAWEREAYDAAPIYTPPPTLGKLPPLRVGLALARLSEFCGVPLPWVHEEFFRICGRQDAFDGVTVRKSPTGASATGGFGYGDGEEPPQSEPPPLEPPPLEPPPLEPSSQESGEPGEAGSAPVDGGSVDGGSMDGGAC